MSHFTHVTFRYQFMGFSVRGLGGGGGGGGGGGIMHLPSSRTLSRSQPLTILPECTSYM